MYGYCTVILQLTLQLVLHLRFAVVYTYTSYGYCTVSLQNVLVTVISQLVLRVCSYFKLSYNQFTCCLQLFYCLLTDFPGYFIIISEIFL